MFAINKAVYKINVCQAALALYSTVWSVTSWDDSTQFYMHQGPYAPQLTKKQLICDVHNIWISDRTGSKSYDTAGY